MKVVVLGLSITSSWGNGHATTYRGVVSELASRGHQVLFCERETPWHRNARDLGELRGASLLLYGSLDELAQNAGEQITEADLVLVGSHVPEGVAVAEYVLASTAGRTAFYDIATPETLARLDAGDPEYLTPALVPRFDLYLSSSGGPSLARLEEYGARRVVRFHPLVDPRGYIAVASRPCWDLGYLGGYSAESQSGLEALMLAPARALRARRFVVAGAQYPEGMSWPANVAHIQHVAPGRHPVFYGAQRFTLNLTRAAMREAGWSPSVRLFQAAACGTAIISDYWPGLEDYFTPEREILIARSADDVLRALIETGIETRLALAARARQRVMREHTAAQRIDLLERELYELMPMGGVAHPAHG